MQSQTIAALRRSQCERTGCRLRLTQGMLNHSRAAADQGGMNLVCRLLTVTSGGSVVTDSTLTAVQTARYTAPNVYSNGHTRIASL